MLESKLQRRPTAIFFVAMHDLLADSCRLVASAPLQSFDEARGLVIDDFFALSIQEKSLPADRSKSFQAYNKAQDAYA